MYYPLSQITTNLYTNGEEFIIFSSRTPYSGYYWKNSKGEHFTGKTPQDTPNLKLIPLVKDSLINVNENENITSYYNKTDDNSINYLNLINPDAPGLPPTFSPNIPNENDYKNGEYKRYFCKKINELIYLEINRDTYNKLISQDPKIQYSYYLPFNISWYLTGDKLNVYNVNKNIVELIMKSMSLYQFDLYLQKNYIKYYK